MQESSETIFNDADCVPDLLELFKQCSLDLKRIILAAVQIKDPAKHKIVFPVNMDRRSLLLTDGKKVGLWKTNSLRALFRGFKEPPVLGDYPEVYNTSFVLMDLHALELSKYFEDRRDAEMKEIYSVLRRRPDGRSLGFVHDYMWQAAALVLGTRPLSQPEFEAIMARLERSCRTFQQSPSSRNYISTLRRTIEKA